MLKSIFRSRGRWLVVPLLIASGQALAQADRVTLNRRDVPLRTILNDIERSTRYLFVYGNEVDVSRAASVNASDRRLDQVLRQLFAGTPVTFRLKGNHILLAAAQAQGKAAPTRKDRREISASGTVTDAGGEPLVGVTVTDKDARHATITDIDGRFTLAVPADAPLTFSYVGFEPSRQAARQNMRVVMSPAVNELGDVVVVGYGTQRKATLTGAVSAIGGDVLKDRNVASLSTALEGTMPGVTIQQTSGQPGSDGGTIRIRGLGSINSDSNPLVLVDGIEMDINQVDPNTIEQVSVLKDAASASIYGSRASNGVILITTKRGRKGHVELAYNGYLTIQTPTNMPKPVKAWQYLQAELDAWDNAGISVSDAQRTQQLAMIEAQKNHRPNNWDRYDTDWKDATIGDNALMYNNNVTLSGGSDKINYFTSLTNLHQDGLIANDNYKRTNFVINADAQVFKWMRVGANASLRWSTQRTPGAGSPRSIINQALYMLPTLSAVRELDGNWGYGKNGLNPTAMAEDSGSQRLRTSENVLGGNVTMTPVDGLELTARYSRRQVTTRERDVVQPYTTSLAGVVMGHYPNEDRVTESWGETVRNYYQLQASYERQLSAHYVKVMGGFQAEDSQYSNFSGSRKDFDLGKWYLGNGDAATATNSGGASSWAMMSWFGRVNYNFAERYLVELVGRWDGSSRFTKGNRWGFFPAVSAGWVVSKEPFMRWMAACVDQLKLRASYGTLGNQNIGNYPYAAVISGGYSYYLGDNKDIANGVAQTTLSNPDIGWEKSSQFNIGIDLTMLNGAITFSGEYYYKKVYDMLMKFAKPYYVGMQPAYTNAGDMRNEGWEVSLGYKGHAGEFEYGARVTLNNNSNKITNLNGNNSADKTLMEGYPLNGIWGYRTDGYYTDWDDVAASPKLSNAARPGFIKYVKVNQAEGTDPMVIDSNDQVYLGDTFPHYEYGVTLNGKWRGIDLSVFLQGVGKRKAYLSGVGLKPFANGSNLFEHQLDSWTPDNQDAAYPILVPEANSNDNYVRSDKWVRNGAYCRLKNVVLGYTLPAKWTKTVGLGGVRAYFSAQNLLTIDSFYDGYDPEVSYGGTVGGEFYPIMRSFTFGIDIKF